MLWVTGDTVQRLPRWNWPTYGFACDAYHTTPQLTGAVSTNRAAVEYKFSQVEVGMMQLK